MTVDYDYSMDPDESEIRERHGLAPARGPRMAKRHRLVLAQLRRAQASVPEGSDFCLSIADLMRLTGLSQASVAFARNDLLRWGLVERVHHGGGACPPTWRVLAPETDAEFLRRAGVSPGGAP